MLHLEFTSTDSYYKSIGAGKILLSNLSSATSVAEIDNSLITTYQGNMFDNVPQCNCGKYKEAYLENQICDECGSPIESVIKKKDPLVWFKKYEETEKFISPYFWLCLRTVLSTKIDVLRYLSDTKYNPVQIPDWLRQCTAKLNYKRGYNNLIYSLSDILDFAIKHSKFKERNKYEELIIYKMLWERDRDKILNEYMGLFNKRLFVVEETQMGHYTNLILGEVKAIAYNYLLNNNEFTALEKKENIMSRIISGMSNITQNYLSENLQGKFGDFRKHLSGARMPFSFRAVIRSMNISGHRDHLHIPWVAGITTFRPHLLNLLVNRFGMSCKKASAHLYEHTKKYCKILDECFKILINESPFGGIVVFFTRNPSLPMGSTQFKIITMVKSDVYDNCTSLSNLTVGPYNADFDGDAMMALMMLDNKMSRLAMSMKVHYSIPGDKRPADISSTAKLPSPTIMTLTNYSHKAINEVDIDYDFINKLNAR